MARTLDRPLRQTVIIDAVRTPIGRYGGALGSVRPDDLAATVIRAIVARTGIDPALVEDVVLGCANQAGEDNRNVARMAALLAGLPVEVAGQTVNRLCGSGLQAVNTASHPLGATGARLATMLVHELARTGGRYGLAAMCIGVGQGIATIVERVEG